MLSNVIRVPHQMMIALLLLSVVAMLMPALSAVAQDDAASQLTQEQIDRMSGVLHQKFMSPFCPGKNLKDCTSGQAAVWRDKIRDWVAEGKSEKWIEDALIAEFGEQILSAPKFKGFNAIVWIFPILAVLVGLGLVFAYLTKQQGMKLSSATPGQNIPDNYEADDELDRRLEEELQQHGN